MFVRGIIASACAFNLLTRIFILPICPFNLEFCAFNHATRAFSLQSRRFELVDLNL